MDDGLGPDFLLFLLCLVISWAILRMANFLTDDDEEEE